MTDQPSHIAVEPADRPVPPNGNPADRPVAISLPDGSIRQYPAPVTGADVAASIGPGRA